MKKIFYHIINRIKRGFRITPQGAIIALIIVFCVGAIFFRVLREVEKRNWDNRVGELWPNLIGVTYLPNIANVTYWPWALQPSSLPKYELKIAGKDMSDLEKNLPGFHGALPDNKKYYAAEFFAEGEKYDVEVRLRGTLPIHWMYREKSWRINFKNKKFHNQSSINLIVPEQKEFFVEQYANYLGRRLGVVTMDSSFVRLSVNGGSAGLYWITEQFGEEFLQRHNLPSSANLYSEDVFLENTQLFSDVDYWRKYTDDASRKAKDFSELAPLITCLNTCDDQAFYALAEKIIDLDNFVRWQALHMILGDDHQDSGHNNVIFFNPTIKKFQFFPWDTNRYKYNGAADILYNPLVGRLLKNPDIRHRRNQIVWAYVSNQDNEAADLVYYDGLYAQTKSAVYKDSKKRYSDWFFDYKVALRRATIQHQFAYLTRLLSVLDEEYLRFDKQEVFVDVWESVVSQPVRFSIMVRSFSDLSLRRVRIPGNLSGRVVYDANRNGTLDPSDVNLATLVYDKDHDRTETSEFSQRIWAERILPTEPSHEIIGSFLPTGYEKLIRVQPTKHDFFIVANRNIWPDVSGLEFKIENAVTKKDAAIDVKYFSDQRISEIMNTSLGMPIGLKDEVATGTPPRIEREFKLGLRGPGLANTSSMDISKLLFEFLKSLESKKDLWQAPIYVTNTYYTTLEPEEFIYRDIYFDTSDRLTYQHGISYRLRNRWTNVAEYNQYLTDQYNPKFYPARVEIQAKTERDEGEEGFSSTTESRFEFRIESAPFGPHNPPPPLPWDLDQFMQYAITGRFNTFITWPGKSLAAALAPYTKKPFLDLQPVLAIADNRVRFHFNINTPYGSGPNPEQVFIFTIDKAEVYGTDYLDFLRQSRDTHYQKKPNARGVIYEMEIEFERNVSTVIDRLIKQAQTDKDANKEAMMKNIRQAFLDDQDTLVSELTAYLKTKNIDLVSVNRSKYLQAHDIVY